MSSLLTKRKKRQTTVRLSPEVYGFIDEQSDNSGLSMSEIIRRLVNKGIEESEIKTAQNTVVTT